MKITIELRDEPGLDYPDNLDLTDNELRQKYIKELSSQVRHRLNIRQEDKIDIVFTSEKGLDFYDMECVKISLKNKEIEDITSKLLRELQWGGKTKWIK